MMTANPSDAIWEVLKQIPTDPNAMMNLQNLCDNFELSHAEIPEDVWAIHLLSHLINFNFLTAKNFSKKAPKEIRTKNLYTLIWKLCTSIAQKTYKDIPEIVKKIANNEKNQVIAKAITYWHNKRMWEYVENGFESISMDNIEKLGIISLSLPDEITKRGYQIIDNFVYPKRQEAEKAKINAAAELKVIAETMRSLEAV